MKYSVTFVLTVIILFLCSHDAEAQCTCMGGAAVGGSMPSGVDGASGVLFHHQLRLSTQYRYSSGDTHFRGDVRAEAGPVLAYRMQYLSIAAGYGLSETVTIETEMGYFLEKYQDFGYHTSSGSGLSHISFTGKYNVYSDMSGDFDAVIGAGGWIPLQVGDKNLPQHVLPSTGAYGAFVQALIQQNIHSSDFRLVFTHRSDISAENSMGYVYGSGFMTSFYTIWNAGKGISALLQFRSEIRLQDKYKGSMLQDSGSNVVMITPQLGYSFDDFYVSALVDLPVYRYYTGHQLAKNGSFALNVSWQNQLLGE